MTELIAWLPFFHLLRPWWLLAIPAPPSLPSELLILSKSPLKAIALIVIWIAPNCGQCRPHKPFDWTSSAARYLPYGNAGSTLRMTPLPAN